MGTNGAGIIQAPPRVCPIVNEGRTEVSATEGERRTVALQEVSEALWEERQLVEQLLFKLEEERTLIEAGAKRWVAWCTDEVNEVLERIDLAEATRAQVWAEVAEQFGLPADASIKQMISHAAFPWDTILNEHRTALRLAAREIEENAHSQVEEVRDAAQQAARRLAWVCLGPVAA